MFYYINMIRRKFIAVNAIQVHPLECTTIIDYAAMRAPICLFLGCIARIS
jgi:hypothetical protein